MKRIFFDNNGTLSDFSTELENYHNGTALIDYTLSQDAIYIGSELPLNSLFLDVSSVNSIAAAPTLSYWDGQQWREMVEVIDETATNGVALAKSGHLTWTTDKQYGWTAEDTVKQDDTEQITGLGSVTVYDLYWLKITYSASVTNTTELSFVGPKFCEQADLKGEYAMLGNSTFISNYESGKTTFDREIVLASRIIIEDLIDMAVIQNGDQLLDRRKLRYACVSKVAEIVFNNLGDDYENDTKKAKSEYKQRISKKNYKADFNANARLDEQEKRITTGGLYR